MDSKTLASEIEYHADQFINAVASFDNDQINAVPFPGSWTAGQVARHIIKATRGLPDNQTAKTTRPIDQQIGIIESVFLNFKEKYQSPESVVPELGPYDKETLVRELMRIKDQNVEIAMSADLSVLCMDFELPVFGYLTRYEWLQFFIRHTQRHLHQLKKISNAVIHSGNKFEI